MPNDNFEAKLKSNFLETSRLLSELAESEIQKIVQAGLLITEAFRAGGKVLACGNGGSAADAQHFVAEFVGRFGGQRPSLPAMTLSVDPSVVTALGNDYGFESVFARQIEGLGRPGDILVAISTSGKSANILAAIDAAKQKKLKVVALVGENVDEKIKNCDLYFSVPSSITPRVQEAHMVILHSICEYVENTR